MGVSNLLYVYGEVGVGGGIVADGHLLEGAHGYGGEVGHMRVNPDGAPCRCGPGVAGRQRSAEAPW